AALEAEVARRTGAEQALLRRSEQLRALAAEVTLAEQRERRRLAKVLHDHLQQLLVGIQLRIPLLGRADDQAAGIAAKVAQRLDECIRTSRSLTAELSPLALEEGLTAGLEWLVRWMADRHDLTVELTVDGRVPSLAEDVKVLLFESIRELL